MGETVGRTFAQGTLLDGFVCSLPFYFLSIRLLCSYSLFFVTFTMLWCVCFFLFVGVLLSLTSFLLLFLEGLCEILFRKEKRIEMNTRDRNGSTLPGGEQNEKFAITFLCFLFLFFLRQYLSLCGRVN